MSYKTEFQANNIDLQSILDSVNALPEEKTLTDLLPTLSNPATSADVANGKEFIDSTGAVVSGTLATMTLPDDVTETYTNGTKYSTAKGISNGTKWIDIVSVDIGDAENFIFVCDGYDNKIIFTETEKEYSYSYKSGFNTITWQKRLARSGTSLVLQAKHNAEYAVNASQSYYCIAW